MSYRIEIDAPEVPFPGGTSHAQFMREAAKRIDGHYQMGSNLTATVVALLHRVADEMDRVNPPRIPEPSLYGVVSSEDDAGLTTYFWHSHGGWHGENGSLFEWEDLVDPVLVRPGIEDES